VLKDEGYIEDFAVRDESGGASKELRIGLKYYAGRPVIERHRAHLRSRPARLQGPRQPAQGHERPGRGDRLDLARRDDRPQGARHRRRRRSLLHRR
jgi:hypothetical protein